MAAPLSHILNNMDSQAPSPPTSHLLSAANALTTIRDGAALMSNGASEAAHALLALVHEDSQLADRRIEAEARAAMNREDSTEAHGISPDDPILAFCGLKRGAPSEGDTAPPPPAKKRKPSPEEAAAGIAAFKQDMASRRPAVPTFPWTATPSPSKRKTLEDEDEDTTPSQPAKRARRNRAPSNRKGRQRTETPRETYLQTRPGQATVGKKVITGEKAIKAIDPLKLTSPVASYAKSSLGKKHRDVAVTHLAELEAGERAPNREIEAKQLRRSLAAIDDEYLTHYPRTLASAETLARWNIPRPAIDVADVPPLKDFVPRAPSERDAVGLTSPERWAAMFAPEGDWYHIPTFMDDEVENEKHFKRWTDEGTKKLIGEKKQREDKENERGGREGKEIADGADRRAVGKARKGKRGLKDVEAGMKVEEKQEVKDGEDGKKAKKAKMEKKETEEKKTEEKKETEETPPDTGRRLRKPSKRQLEMEEESGIDRKKK